MKKVTAKAVARRANPELAALWTTALWVLALPYLLLTVQVRRSSRTPRLWPWVLACTRPNG